MHPLPPAFPAPAAAGSYTSWSRGVYACAYDWSKGIRINFEARAGAGGALAYSKYAGAYPMTWPASLNSGRPYTLTFVLTSTATDWSGKYGGYPTLVQSGSGGCGGTMCG